MPYDIAVDREKQLSFLYNPETGRALGPIGRGAESEQQLEAFVGALEHDPTTLLPWDLMGFWDAFVAGFVAGEPSQPVELAGPVDEPVPGNPEPDQAPELDAQPDTSNGDIAELAITTEAQADQPPAWASTPSCVNCSNRTFHVEGGELRCTICGEPAPEGAQANA